MLKTPVLPSQKQQVYLSCMLLLGKLSHRMKSAIYQTVVTSSLPRLLYPYNYMVQWRFYSYYCVPSELQWRLIFPPFRIICSCFVYSANNFALQNKRKTISGRDVLDAMEEMEFEKFVEPLKRSLEGMCTSVGG